VGLSSYWTALMSYGYGDAEYFQAIHGIDRRSEFGL
jgi:hypothetical protein